MTYFCMNAVIQWLYPSFSLDLLSFTDDILIQKETCSIPRKRVPPHTLRKERMCLIYICFDSHLSYLPLSFLHARRGRVRRSSNIHTFIHTSIFCLCSHILPDDTFQRKRDRQRRYQKEDQEDIMHGEKRRFFLFYPFPLLILFHSFSSILSY